MEAETAVIPDDKPSTGGFMDLIQKSENLMLDITGRMTTRRRTLEDSILKTLSNTTRWWQILMLEAAGVAPAMPLINEIKALSSFEDYRSKLGTYELAGRPSHAI